MNTVIRSIMPVAILGVCLLAMPADAVAGKPGSGKKGGTPNPNSVATTAACLVDSDTARVCSSKGISNVAMWCGTTWIKHEDFGGGDVYETTVDCVNGQGDAIPGPITMIAVKSGSQKNAKHHPDGYTPVDGAPSGSGLFTTPLACASNYSCETADDAPVGDDPDVPVGDTPPGDGGTGNPPADGSDDGTPPGDGSDGGTPPGDGSDGGTPPPGDPIEIPPDDPVLY